MSLPDEAARPAPIPLGLFGATGRMGQRIQAALADGPGAPFALRRAVGRGAAGDFGGCAAVIDFSQAEATAALLAQLAGTGAALITGTTGRDAGAEAALDAYARTAPVLAAANFSLGVAVLAALVEQAARALGPGFAGEIFELHHGHKRDAPSGTALALGEALARGQGLAWPAARQPAREGLGPARGPGEIGLAALRGGEVIGEHTVFLLGPGERLELSHRAGDRSLFAHGALRAAAWLVGRAPGRYTIGDLLPRP